MSALPILLLWSSSLMILGAEQSSECVYVTTCVECFAHQRWLTPKKIRTTTREKGKKYDGSPRVSLFDGHLGHLAPIIPPFGSMALQKYRVSHHVCVCPLLSREIMKCIDTQISNNLIFFFLHTSKTTWHHHLLLSISSFWARSSTCENVLCVLLFETKKNKKYTRKWWNNYTTTVVFRR